MEAICLELLTQEYQAYINKSWLGCASVQMYITVLTSHCSQMLASSQLPTHSMPNHCWHNRHHFFLYLYFKFCFQKIRTDVTDMESLGELGHGTCGQVVRMRHKPSSLLMAVKVDVLCFWQTGTHKDDNTLILCWAFSSYMNCHVNDQTEVKFNHNVD